MAIDLNEPAVTALRTRLEADLPAAITLINAAVTDGFTIENPAAVLDYVPPLGVLTAFPTIGIGDGRGRFEDDNGHSATFAGELVVIAYLQDADQRALAWRLRRYAQAITRVALDDRNLGDAAWGTGLAGLEPGPTLADNPDDPKEFASWVAVRIWLKSEEE